MSSLSYMDPEYDQEFIRPAVRDTAGLLKLFQNFLMLLFFALRNTSIDKSDTPSVKAHWIQKGERLGEFRLGSTVVLLLEVPPEFQWDVVSE